MYTTQPARHSEFNVNLAYVDVRVERGPVRGRLALQAGTSVQSNYGAGPSHYLLLALTVDFTLVGVVLWGSLAGSMLPFLLRRLGFDPASASAVRGDPGGRDGAGAYFGVASMLLTGKLL